MNDSQGDYKRKSPVTVIQLCERILVAFCQRFPQIWIVKVVDAATPMELAD